MHLLLQLTSALSCISISLFIVNYFLSNFFLSFFLIPINTQKKNCTFNIFEKQTSVPTLKRKEGSASIRFLSMEQCCIRKDRGQDELCNNNNKKGKLRTIREEKTFF